MKRLVLLLIAPMVLWAQPEFFGYFESEADIMQLGGQRYSFGYNKLRLDVEARPSDNILIGANLTAQSYRGRTTWNLFDFLPEHAWLTSPYFDPASSSISEAPEIPFSLQDTLFLNNMYLKLSLGLLDLTLGRQQISPGVGYAWNPTDIFNTKTLMDPSYEQPGVSAIRMELPLRDRLTLSAIFQPKEDSYHSTEQFGVKTGLGSFDFEFTVAEYLAADFSPQSMGALKSQKALVGGSIIGEIMEWGVWFEGAQFTHVYNDDYNETVLGVDHTFDNSVYVLFEYLHNESGVTDKAGLTFFDYVYALEGSKHSLMQDYTFLYLMHPTFDYVSLSALAITNFNDNSGTFAPQLDWNAFEDTNISIQGSLFWGEDDTEFGLQDWGVRLRLRSDF